LGVVVERHTDGGAAVSHGEDAEKAVTRNGIDRAIRGYLADAIVVLIGEVEVPAAIESGALSGSPTSPPASREIGRRFSVNRVLEGSVTRPDDRLAVSTKLVDAIPGTDSVITSRGARSA
jgi:hypothetical protein